MTSPAVTHWVDHEKHMNNDQTFSSSQPAVPSEGLVWARQHCNAGVAVLTWLLSMPLQRRVEAARSRVLGPRSIPNITSPIAPRVSLTSDLAPWP